MKDDDNHVALQYFLTFPFHSCLLSMQACKDSMSVAMLTACCKSLRVQVSLGRPRFLSCSSMSNFSLKTQHLTQNPCRHAQYDQSTEVDVPIMLHVMDMQKTVSGQMNS